MAEDYRRGLDKYRHDYPNSYGDFNYLSVPTEVSSIGYHGYEPSIYKLFEYHPPCYYGAYGSNISFTTSAYSASSFSQPISVEYDPKNLYGGSSNPGQTQFVISHKVSELSVPEFEEYDPTPYGGGYDQAQTYGKPLPPSDDICYPLSNTAPVSSLDGGAGGGESVKPEKPSDASIVPVEPTGEKQPESRAGRLGGEDDELESYHGQPFHQGEEVQETYGGENYAGLGFGSGAESGRVMEKEWKPVPQMPSGYGLEAIDLCESLFGYWPCLGKYGKGGDDAHGNALGELSHGNGWKRTEDYLFGNSNPYEQTSDGEGGHGWPVYSYQRHYQEEPIYGQIEYVKDSWLD